jgi:hypothetical protein
MTTERELVLHSQQGEVFDSPARYRVVASGRRWGKTTLGCAVLADSLVRKPHKYWYLAPELKQARDIAWRMLLQTLPRSWWARKPNESRLEVELRNGSSIGLVGADNPDSLRGRGLGGIVIDEYADIDPAVWDEIIQPALLDTQGWALILGTPKGFDHFYDLYRQGQDPAFVDWASWQYRTTDAPHIRLEDLETLRHQYEQRGQLRLYAQEFEASFESNAGYILGALWKASHTVGPDDIELQAGGLPLGKVVPWHVWPHHTWKPSSEAHIYGSVDYGFGAAWSAHLHAAMTNGHTRTFHEWYGREIRDVDQAQRMHDTISRLMRPVDEGGIGMKRPEWVVMDPSMWNSRKEMGLAKSIAEVYQDILGAPLHIQLMPGAAGRPARISRPQRWMTALLPMGDGLPTWSVTSACPELIRTVPRVPWDEDDIEVEDGDSENHSYEDVGRFFEARPIGPKPKPLDRFAHLDPVSRAHQEAMAKKEAGRKTQRTTVPGMRT